jgi:hypothetical protein
MPGRGILKLDEKGVKPKTQFQITRIDAANFPAHTRCMANKLGHAIKKTGSYYCHCDWQGSHRVKAMLDQIFDKNNFQIE